MFGEAHAHLLMNGRDYYEAVACHEGKPDDQLIRNAFEAYASNGITFVRDGGDALGVSKLAKQLAPEYGIDYRSPIFAIHKNGHYGGIVGLGFDNMREYAALVDRAAAEGADFIKIMTTGIMDFNEYGRITGRALDAKEVREMAHIAHENGMAVMSHTNGKRAVLEAIEAGVSSIEHANYIDEECLAAFAETGCVYVPTATVAYSLVGSGHGDDAVLQRIWEQSAASICKALENPDVTVALGSDGGAVGVPHAEGLLSEYKCFNTAAPTSMAPEQLDARLQAGDQRIRDTFKRA